MPPDMIAIGRTAFDEFCYTRNNGCCSWRNLKLGDTALLPAQKPSSPLGEAVKFLATP